MANSSHIAQAVCSEQVAEPTGWRTCHKEGHTNELLIRLTCPHKGGNSDCMPIAEAYRPAVKLIPKEDRACLAWAKPMSCYKQCSDLTTVSHIASALQRSCVSSRDYRAWHVSGQTHKLRHTVSLTFLLLHEIAKVLQKPGGRQWSPIKGLQWAETDLYASMYDHLSS